jgi:hypothetical protein
MSDPNDESDTPKSDPDVLAPERNGPSRKAEPKAPPVIEGEAEAVDDDAEPSGGMPQDGASDAGRRAPAGVASVAGAALAAGLIGALVVGGGLYVFGLLGPDEGDATALDALKARIEANATTNEAQTNALSSVEEKLAAATREASSAAAIAARLDELEASTKDLAGTLDAAQSAAAEQSARVDELAKAMPPADIGNQITQLSAMVKALNTAVDALAPKIDDLSARVAALEAKKDDPDAAERAALSLALSNLSRAATRAEPFARELDVVATFLPDEPELAELKTVAAEGVPTETSLEARFPQVVKDVLDAERAASDDSIWQRFVSNAKKLVTLRRTGEIAGDDTDAVLARMEERVARGDLSAALAEAKALKGRAAAAAAPWVTDATARVTTSDLLAALTADVTKRLSEGAMR